MSAVEGVVEAAASDHPALTAGRSRVLLAIPFTVAIVMIALIYWTIDIVSPALPDAKEDLELSAKSAGLIFSILFLGRLIGNFPAAYLMNRFGTSFTAISGGAVLIVSTTLAAMAPNGVALLAARVSQGIGIALLVNACLRAVIGAKPGRGAAMTYFSFAATAGGVIGLQSGGYLTEEFNWRAVFVLSAFIAALLTVIASVSRVRTMRGEMVVDVVPKAQADGGIALRVLMPPLLLNFALFCNYAVFVALPLYTEHDFGSSPEVNARLLMVISVVHLLGAFPAGRVIRVWGAQRSLVAGLVISLIGTALILAMPSPMWIALPLVLYGIGQVSATSAGGDIVLHLGGQSTRAVGFVRFSSDLGLVVGPFLTGAVSDAFDYEAPFLVLPVLMAAASLYALQQVIAAGDRRI